jgi:hypothetical protein
MHETKEKNISLLQFQRKFAKASFTLVQTHLNPHCDLGKPASEFGFHTNRYPTMKICIFKFTSAYNLQHQIVSYNYNNKSTHFIRPKFIRKNQISGCQAIVCARQGRIIRMSCGLNERCTIYQAIDLRGQTVTVNLLHTVPSTPLSSVTIYV